MAGTVTLQAIAQFRHGSIRPPRNGAKNVARGRETSFDAGVLRMNASLHHPANPGINSACRTYAMMQVEVPTTFTTSRSLRSGADRVPVRV